MAFLAFCRKLTQSLTIAIGLFVATCALIVFLWPVLFPSVRPDLAHRVARMPLLLLLLMLAGAAWSILCVAIAQKAAWTTESGAKFALFTLFAVSFVFSVASSKFFPLFALVAPVAWFYGRLFSTDAGWRLTAVQTPEYLTTLHLDS